MVSVYEKRTNPAPATLACYAVHEACIVGVLLAYSLDHALPECSGSIEDKEADRPKLICPAELSLVPSKVDQARACRYS